jgi:hypothetical protein
MAESTEVTNEPVWMDHEELVTLLQEVTDRVRKGDSFEGTVAYTIPEPTEKPELSNRRVWMSGFMVQAIYRTGGLMGKNDIKIIGSRGNND